MREVPAIPDPRTNAGVHANPRHPNQVEQRHKKDGPCNRIHEQQNTEQVTPRVTEQRTAPMATPRPSQVEGKEAQHGGSTNGRYSEESKVRPGRLPLRPRCRTY